MPTEQGMTEVQSMQMTERWSPERFIEEMEKMEREEEKMLEKTQITKEEWDTHLLAFWLTLDGPVTEDMLAEARMRLKKNHICFMQTKEEQLMEDTGSGTDKTTVRRHYGTINDRENKNLAVASGPRNRS